MFVKICGITNREDALAAVDAGAQALGFIFCERTPRYVKPEALASWIADIPRDIWKVGVFVDETPPHESSRLPLRLASTWRSSMALKRLNNTLTVSVCGKRFA